VQSSAAPRGSPWTRGTDHRETCIQYLWFAAEEIPDGATEFKCAPPIRNTANREALWAALEDGSIDLVATDHSPCPPEMKGRDEGRWDLAWAELPPRTCVAVMWTAMERRGMDFNKGMEQIAAWMSAGPAKLAGLNGRKGALVAGADADFVVFDPVGPWTSQKRTCISATSSRLIWVQSCAGKS